MEERAHAHGGKGGLLAGQECSAWESCRIAVKLAAAVLYYDACSGHVPAPIFL